MQPGELKRRRKAKALRSLDRERPHFTTTEALCLIDAECGPIRFHRLLARRGQATPRHGFDKGYDFALPSAYGGGTYSINHHSFQWTPEGVAFMATVLGHEGIGYRMSEKLAARIPGAASSPNTGGAPFASTAH
jgi:hypothetical protein